MGYVLDRFAPLDGTAVLTLPLLEANQDIGTGAARTTETRLAGGEVYDALGNDQARRSLRSIKATGELVGDPATNHTDYLAILAAYGKKGKLYRRGVGIDQINWTLARLVDIGATADPESAYVLPVSLQFLAYSAVWHGQQHGTTVNLDSGYFLDTGRALNQGDAIYIFGGADLPTSGSTITLTNAGDAYVSDCVISVYNGATPFTSLTIENLTTGAETGWVWTGTLGVDKTLVISNGTKRVVNDGVAAFSEWARTGTNTITDWLRLLPGANAIRVSWTGGGGSASIAFAYENGFN